MPKKEKNVNTKKTLKRKYQKELILSCLDFNTANGLVVSVQSYDKLSSFVKRINLLALIM